MAEGQMSYNSPARRRARVASRYVLSAAHPRSYPKVGVIPAFWWDGHANFGDALTPWLLRPRGVLPVLASPHKARMVGVGSILEHLPDDFDGVVWGTGLIRDAERALPRATYLAVRGALTRDNVGAPEDVVLGDPGLLVSDVVRRHEPRYELGLVPHSDHWSSPEVQDFQHRGDPRIRFIDVSGSPDRVVREISRCHHVLSTSLHGLVVADSYGVPAAWARLAPDLIGATYKFHDHESVVTPGWSRQIDLAVGDTVESVVERTRPAEPERVRASVEGLRHTVAQLPVTRVFPPLAWWHR
jgi:hypothetical protein